MPRRLHLAAVATVAVLLAGCGDDQPSSAGEDRPLVVVSASLLGDVVENVVGDQADVEVLIPAGADPHDFQLSAQQVARLREADALVVNGGGFEEAMADPLESARADGVPTFEALGAVEPLAGEHEGADHEHEAADHEHEGADPHFFTDPARTAQAARELGGFLAEAVDGIDADAIESSADAYATELEELDAEVEAILGAVPEERRVLVTNHDVLSYFADRYDFEVVGVVVPGGGTGGGGSAGELARLAATVRETDVPAIFVDTSSPDELARTLAEEVGDVEVVALFTESLGEEGSGGETYVDMVRTNAERIADALAGAAP